MLLGHASRGEAANTCDPQYYGDGQTDGTSCAYLTFACYNYICGVDYVDYKTCFEGAQLSPINLNRSTATVADPGALTFSYTSKSKSPVLRLQGYSLQLDFDATTGSGIGGTSWDIAGGPLEANRR